MEEPKKGEKDEARKRFHRKYIPVYRKDDPFIIECLFCSDSYEYTSMLKHISHRKLCREFYGPKFDEMKRRHARIRKQLYREKNGVENELQVQKEKYNSDPKLRERKKIEYKKRKEESKVLELKEKKEYFRKSEIESVIYDIDRLKNSNSTYSCKKKWLIKCFDHYFNPFSTMPF